MSNFDETMLKRLTRLEREVERLRVHGAHKAGMYADTYFDDLQYQMVGQKMESPSSHIVYHSATDTINFYKTCDWNDDWITMVIQMSHRWKVGSVIYPHLHWVQQAAAMPNLIIGWRWNVNGAAWNGTYAYIKHSANVYDWSSGNLNQITKFGSITPPSGAGLSDLLFIRIYRDVANESTEFTGAENDANVQDDVFACSFDIHFEIDSAGSDTEYVK